MKTVSITAAKICLSDLVEKAAAGGEVIITKAGKPVARLVALEKPNFRKSFGIMKGLIHASDNFDDPLPREILRSFGVE